MRAAPPVSVRCTGGSAWRGVQSVLPAVAAGAVIAWTSLLATQGGDAVLSDDVPLLAAGGIAALVAALAWRLCRPASAQLVWDGQQWRVDGVPLVPAVMVDLGVWMLLRLQLEQPRRTRWLAVGSSEAGAAWHGLRTALFMWVPPKAEAGHV